MEATKKCKRCGKYPLENGRCVICEIDDAMGDTGNGRTSEGSTTMSKNRVWLVETDNRELLHMASTEKKAWAFASVHLDYDPEIDLTVRPVAVDSNIDPELPEDMARVDVDEQLYICDCGGEFLKKDMKEIMTTKLDSDWFCQECAPKVPKMSTEMFDGMKPGMILTEPCPTCGGTETLVVKHLGRAMGQCKGCWYDRIGSDERLERAAS